MMGLSISIDNGPQFDSFSGLYRNLLKFILPELPHLTIISLASRVCSELVRHRCPYSSAVERIHGKDQTSFRLRVGAPAGKQRLSRDC